MAEITREQVERALARAQAGDYGASEALQTGGEWLDGVPRDVVDAWYLQATEMRPFIAALTRWRDSLPVSKVARWDARARDYRLSPPHRLTDPEGSQINATREQAIAWGYTIEGGPEPLTSAAMRAICSECGGDGVVHSPDGRILGECRSHTPAPEVVDVPQPEPWHARLVRLAQEARDANAAYDAAEDALAQALKATREAHDALREATGSAAILEAAQLERLLGDAP